MATAASSPASAAKSDQPVPVPPARAISILPEQPKETQATAHQSMPHSHIFFALFALALVVFSQSYLIQPVFGEIAFINGWAIDTGAGEDDQPSGVAVSDTGQVYVSYPVLDLVRRFDATGRFETQWGSRGTGDGQFRAPRGVAVSATGQVYVVDDFNNRVQRFDADGTYQTQFGTAGSGDGQFNAPVDVAVSGTGQVYVTDGLNDRVQQFDADGTYQTQFGNSGTGDGQFDFPSGVAVSPFVSLAGQVLVADARNDRVQRFDADGTYRSQIGSPGTGDGQFDSPRGVAVSRTGDIYVVDSNNNRLQRFGGGPIAFSQYETQVGFYAGNAFDRPQHVAVSDTGLVYVTDAGSNQVLRFLDFDAWISGTNAFVDEAFGPTSIRVGPGEILGASPTLDAGKELIVGGTTTFNVFGTLTLDGGTLRTGAIAGLAGFRDRFEFISGTLNLTGPSGLTVNAAGQLGALVTVDSSQSLIVDNTTTITSGSRITVDGTFTSDLLLIESNGQLDAPTGFANADEIQLGGPSARITGASLTNSGVVSGEGRIDAAINNMPTGEFRTASSERLVFTAAGNANEGSISTTSGNIEFFHDLTNTGRVNVTGASTLRFGGGLVNTGDVALSFASATLFGDITNNGGGIVSLAGDSTATFFGDVINEGAIFVGAGSRAVFAGNTSGSGSFPGGGTVEFVDGFMPGSSPAIVSFGGNVEFGVLSATEIELGGLLPGEFDRLDVTGDVNIEGQLVLDLINGFTPSGSDIFEILDVGGELTGQFIGLDEGALLASTSGALFEISYLGGDGNNVVLTVVPEPAAIGLIFIAIALPYFVCRRFASE